MAKEYQNRFIITGYPRSMTAWWSNYCNVGKYTCTHERSLMAFIEDKNCDASTIASSLKPFQGDADPSWLLFPDILLNELNNGLRILVIKRYRKSAFESTMRVVKGTPYDNENLIRPMFEKMEETMDTIKQRSGVEEIFFGPIEGHIIRAHKFLMPNEPVNKNRYLNLSLLNITKNYNHSSLRNLIGELKT